MLETIFCAGILCLFVAACAPVLFSGRNGASWKLSLLFCTAGSALILAPSSIVAYTGDAAVIGSFRMLPSPGVSLGLDRLSAFFIAAVSMVSFCVSVYSFGYAGRMEGDRGRRVLCSLMSVFVASMVLAVASRNTFSFLFFWELMSVSSFLLVLTEYREKEVRKAGLFYFVMTQLSTAFLLCAFIGLYSVSGSFDMAPAEIPDQLLSAFVGLSLFAGFAIKAGVVPFHKWLPYAHTASPSNVSALMSGVMIKVAVYGLVRFTLDFMGTEIWWGVLILVAGTVSAILGVIYALKEHDIKRLLAYHSIENIGIILIGLGAYVIFSLGGLPELAGLSLAGSLFHALNHAVFKSLLFLTAGSVVSGTGIRNIEEMGGLIKRMPYTSVFFLVGAVSISGLPPLNGFASEFMIFQALLRCHLLEDPFLEVLLLSCLSIFALTSALAAACFVKAYGITFLAMPRSGKAANAIEATPSMLYAPAVLSLLCVILGVFSYQIFSSAGYALPMPDLLVAGVFLAAFCMLSFLALYPASKNKARTVETWACGMPSLSGRNEYTASGFSQPVVRMFKFVYRTREERKAAYFDGYNALFREGSGDIKLMKFFEEALYLPAARRVNDLSLKVSRMQNWNLDTYVAYAFIAVLLILVYAGWFI